MFSILVAHYNNGRFFKDCYQSILAQSSEDWEVVILDDGSTDNSLEIIKNLIAGDKRFRLFENNENHGVGFTKAKLIDLAEGEICGYLDPDDALLPRAVAASLEIFRTHPKVVLTYSRHMKCDKDLKPVQEFKSAMQVPNGDLHFFNCPIQIAHFVGFKKSVYLTCERMDPALKIAEDQDLYLKMYEKGNICFINQTDYLYRAHDGGISQNDNKVKTYQYFAKAIFAAIKRRNIASINGKTVPASYENPQEIFDLLSYQNTIPYRLKKKMRVMLQKI